MSSSVKVSFNSLLKCHQCRKIRAGSGPPGHLFTCKAGHTICNVCKEGDGGGGGGEEEEQEKKKKKKKKHNKKCPRCGKGFGKPPMRNEALEEVVAVYVGKGKL